MKVSNIKDQLDYLEKHGYGIKTEVELVCGDEITHYHFCREVWTDYGSYVGLDWGCIRLTTPLAGIIAKRKSVSSYFSPYYTEDTDRPLREAYRTDSRSVYKKRI